MTTNYPELHRELQLVLGKLAKELPGPMGGFGRLHKEATQAGALATKTKELMALAISIVARCESCIAFHVHDALRAGATRQEVLETIGVAVMMGGGPASMYACEAYDALQQFEAKPAGV
jgi:AhpD family alkylhydroperoxidase